jgi:triosephosphate isomerase
MMRKPMLAGNWKMYKSMAETVQFIDDLSQRINKTEQNCEILLCVPFTNIAMGKGSLKKNQLFGEVKIGAQNMHYADEGAFTGEISPIMLKELDVEYVILGHSERRTYFHEDDELIAKKVEAAFRHGITPILCVGETLAEHEAGRTEEVVKRQTELAIRHLSSDEAHRLVIAYEPVWAIGTGKTASAALANEVIAYIRRVVADQFDQQVANQVRILYGGSVKPENIGQFMNESDIDGALVGGASLSAVSFAEMITAVNEVKK